MTVKHLGIVGAALALLGSGSLGARAQSSSKGLDYSKLYNRTYSYADLVQAKSNSLSDRQIAKMLKIATKSGQPFHYILTAVQRGENFTQIALKNGVNPSELKDVVAEEDEISAFEAAYESTGSQGARTSHALPGH